MTEKKMKLSRNQRIFSKKKKFIKIRNSLSMPNLSDSKTRRKKKMKTSITSSKLDFFYLKNEGITSTRLEFESKES